MQRQWQDRPVKMNIYANQKTKMRLAYYSRSRLGRTRKYMNEILCVAKSEVLYVLCQNNSLKDRQMIGVVYHSTSS